LAITFVGLICDKIVSLILRLVVSYENQYIFEQHPYFPLWLQSEAFDKVLTLEPFAKEL